MLGKNGRIDVKESSSNRYPHLSEYPQEIYLDAYHKFRDYICGQLSNIGILQDENSEIFISDNVIGLMKRSGFYGQPNYYKWMKNHKIPIDSVWYYLPDCCKYYLGNLFNVPHKNINAPILMSEEYCIIDKTIRHHIVFLHKNDNDMRRQDMDN